MSILRERQIKQILDDENILKRQVLDREKAQIKDYQETIKPPEVLDSVIVDNNRTNVNKFINKVNQLYIRLRVLRDSNEFFDTLMNTKGNEYRKYISLLNINEYYTDWENLMTEYTNLRLNQITKENIKINLLKIQPYVEEIVRILSKNIEVICNIWKYQQGFITVDTLFRTSIDLDKFPREFTEKEEFKFIDNLKAVNSNQLLLEHIETLAFFQVLNMQFKQNNYDFIQKSTIAYEITSIVNQIQIQTGSKALGKTLLAKYNKLLPG
jgi:hypothetical protein